MKQSNFKRLIDKSFKEIYKNSIILKSISYLSETRNKAIQKNFYQECKLTRYLRKRRDKATQNKFWELWNKNGKSKEKVKYYYLKALEDKFGLPE